jgi:hypothetical protein
MYESPVINGINIVMQDTIFKMVELLVNNVVILYAYIDENKQKIKPSSRRESLMFNPNLK